MLNNQIFIKFTLCGQLRSHEVLYHYGGIFMKKLVCTAVALAALLCAQPSQAGIGISPRLALPLGDFGDIVGTGFGLSVVMDKDVKGKPGRVGLSFLTFGDGDLGSGTAVGAFAGYKHQFGAIYGKFDTNLLRITTEVEIFGFKAETTETKVKLTPGIGYQMGNLAAEIDVDLAGDWAGVNLYYVLGAE
ncbi:MAG: hypothetical protein ACI906_000585 [Candidatus Latescibacterota bacterium]|jgi:hypothetical protein